MKPALVLCGFKDMFRAVRRPRLIAISLFEEREIVG